MPEPKNGRDHRDMPALQVAVPLEKMPQETVRVVRVTDSALAAAPELHRALYNMVVQMVPALNENTFRTDACYQQLIVLSRLFNELEKRGRETRVKVDSQHDDIADASSKVENAAEKVEQAVEAMEEFVEKTNPGLEPRGETDSERFARHTKLQQQADDAAKWREYQDEIKKAREKSRDARRSLYFGVAGGVLLVIILAIGGFVWHATTLAATKALDDQKAQEEHEKGVSEGRAAAPVMVVPVPSPPSSVEPAVTMPSASAPRRRP